MPKIQYKASPKEVPQTSNEKDPPIRKPAQKPQFSLQSQVEHPPANQTVLRMALYPFQYWRKTDEDLIKEEDIIQSHILDYADDDGHSAQQLAHLERTKERATFYKELKEYHESLEAARARRSGLTDEQVLKEKYAHAKQDKTLQKPTPPLSKYL